MPSTSAQPLILCLRFHGLEPDHGLLLPKSDQSQFPNNYPGYWQPQPSSHTHFLRLPTIIQLLVNDSIAFLNSYKVDPNYYKFYNGIYLYYFCISPLVLVKEHLYVEWGQL